MRLGKRCIAHSASIALMLFFCLTAPAAAFPPKLKKAPLDRDKINDVIGAVWQLHATNTATGAVQQFKCRAKDGFFYNDAAQKMGSFQPIKKGVTKVIFFDNAPLPGNATITMTKFRHWAGTMKTKEAEWKLKFEVKDR